CLLEDSLRVSFVECFDARKWTSTLVAQHLLRYGMSSTLDLALHDVFWDVGNAARKSIRNNVSPIANAKQNWAAWMYMSWSFDPSQHPSVYTGGGLNSIGLPRHATFLALRSAVARTAKTSTPYTDVQNAAAFAPSSWVLNVTKFGIQHLNDRLDGGDKPEGSNLTAARDAVTQAIATAQRRVPDAQRATIASWGNQLLARLQ
ncbi:MAG TPA: hypothetical protein VM100_09780, partial [Longimicrobiales bacterium]|nr:hypothetical protein [Longimicrobiales bacterium]